jgi:hypothetical protein
MLPIAVMLLGSCSSQVEQEKKRLDIVKTTGDKDAICTQSRRVAEAVLAANDAEHYRAAKLEADLDCQDADLSRG